MLPTKRVHFTVVEVFNSCCDKVRDIDRASRLAANEAKMEAAARDYEAAGAAGAIHGIVAATYEPYATATVDDFVWLYDQRLVKSKSGRVYYMLIRDSNRGGRCALCNTRNASTLDHHLPKTMHPIFSVAPDNLLPACRDCNSAKLVSLKPTLNTNFDDLGPGPWLKVAIREVHPFVPEFHLEVQSEWSPALAARAQTHFELFGLRELYAYQANRQLAGLQRLLTEALVTEGMAGVRQRIQENARSWADSEPNSWEAALYTALAASDWFCGGGFAT